MTEFRSYGHVPMVKTVPAGRFKAQCLALLDEVAETGEPIIVTKRGKPVAKVIPAEHREPPSLAGSIVREGDIVSPIPFTWDAEK